MSSAARAAVEPGIKRYENTEIDLANLETDVYQRDLNEEVLADIRRGFDESLARQLHVSVRDDKFFLIDGQHTRAILAEKGIQRWCARLHFGLTKEEEADLFTQYNDHARTLRPPDRYRARLCAGDETFLAIEKTLNRFNITGDAKQASAAFRVGSTRTIEAVYKWGQVPLLEATLGLCVEAWPPEHWGIKQTLHSRVYSGIGGLLHRVDRPLTRTRILNLLTSCRMPFDIHRLAQAHVQGGDGPNSGAVTRWLFKQYTNGFNHPELGRQRKLQKDCPTLSDRGYPLDNHLLNIADRRKPSYFV